MKPLRVRHGRFLAFLGLLAATVPALAAFASWDFALAAGFDVAALAFIGSAAGHWRDGAPDTIRRQALRDDGGRLILLLITCIVLVLVLIVVGGLVERKPRLTLSDIGFILATLVIAWIFVNLVFAFHYARLFYDRGADGNDYGGLDFPGGEEPRFADFVNFSFVLGMTCQTADIAITSASMRRASTVHGVMAFFFNLVVLALTVNVVASAV